MNAPHWAPESERDYDRLKGLQVISRDGERLGRISHIVHPDHDATPASGGHFFLFQPTDRKDWFGGVETAYLPELAMTDVTDEGVLIDMTEDEIRRRRWDSPVTEGYHQS
ncbi:MAG: PRC-barrel domain-containing protein [Thermomicrobiales bacterium]